MKAKPEKNPAQPWGMFRLQVRGGVKWTSLAGGFYWGKGYPMTRAQAEGKALDRLRELVAGNGSREYRINATEVTK